MTPDALAHRLPQTLPGLTSLRFAAALLVMAYHYALAFAPAALEASGLLAKGYLGVDFFFVLSGFFLRHVYLAAREAGRFSYLDFIWARLARIYPLHLATTIAAMVILGVAYRIGAIQDDPIYADFVLKTLAMVHAWGTVGHFGLNAPSWSISAEWAAYLAFPLFLAVTLTLRNRPIAFTLMALASLFGADALSRATLGKPVTDLAFDFGILRIAPEFLFGCALYTLARTAPLTASMARVGLLTSGALVLAMLQMKAPDLLIVALMGALIVTAALSTRADADGRTDFLSAPALVWLGEASYAIYLTHRLVEYALTDVAAPLTGFDATGLAAIAIAAPATLICAAVLHHFVERPSRTILRRLPPSAWHSLLRPAPAKD